MKTKSVSFLRNQNLRNGLFGLVLLSLFVLPNQGWSSEGKPRCEGEKTISGQLVKEGSQFILVSQGRSSTSQIFFDLGEVTDQSMEKCAEVQCKAKLKVDVIGQVKQTLLTRYKAHLKSFVEELSLFRKGESILECAR